MNINDLEKAITKMKGVKELFHSEAELQFELAQQIKKVIPDCEIWFEFPGYEMMESQELLEGEKSRAPMIDLVVSHKDKWYPIEIKYAKGEVGEVKNHKYKQWIDSRGNRYLLRPNGKDKAFFYVYDIKRLEIFKKSYEKKFKEGYAVIFSNNELWFKKDFVKSINLLENLIETYRFDTFYLDGNGRRLPEFIKYKNNDNVACKEEDKEKEFYLNGMYNVDWQDYSDLQENNNNNDSKITKNTIMKYNICVIK